MANRIFRELLAEKINIFNSTFTSSKEIFYDHEQEKFIHAGEFGKYREQITKELLGLILPRTLGITSGFIIDSYDHVSRQCDIIIYDKEETPIIHSSYNQEFIPIEAVLLVGEVKSNIENNTDLEKYLKTLSEFKKIRRNIKNPTVKRKGKDQIGTFLICKKLPKNFNYDTSALYSDEDTSNKHNLILSIDNGLYAYATNEVMVPYPMEADRYITANNQYEHIERFLFYIRQIATLTTRLSLELIYYYTDNWINSDK